MTPAGSHSTGPNAAKYTTATAFMIIERMPLSAFERCASSGKRMPSAAISRMPSPAPKYAPYTASTNVDPANSGERSAPGPGLCPRARMNAAS